ncbi:phosphatidylglycerol lysyltransferase domain-containing protein [Flavobacteriaceae bacterium F89]|uniref:Phosphatidylglycerol lysyltransferase domain-containing protein n=1 Tax=Cerina litoralis TaxID=2874477 RepID=A0AAE3EW41_9FLAO|nr:phosphatidylglycerol lysyltransferase domain-containing protein [Cerina litoralis]MCG2461244.1 phosphatidylglycerol lysyltransferase domain-containing protein [Cerina litoralis]
MANRVFIAVKNKRNLAFKISISLLILIFAIYFLKEQQTEIGKVRESLQNVDLFWLSLGILLVLLFVLVQGIMYQRSFKAVNESISLRTGIFLFLKRNTVSVVLPAGLITNMFFFNKGLERQYGIGSDKSYAATSVFTFVSIVSALFFALPIILVFALTHTLFSNYLLPIGIGLVIILLLVLVLADLLRKGRLFRLFVQRFPRTVPFLTLFQDDTLKKGMIVQAFLLSCAVEIIGVIQLYVSLRALGANADILTVVIGYAVVLLVLMTAPLLRGIGAVELGLLYTLKYFGYGTVLALSATLVFRFFEFWSVLLLGLFSLLFKKDGLFLQLLAPILLFFLGVVNLLSALSPALVSRLRYLRDFIPFDVIQASNTLVLVMGIILIITAVTLTQGYRNSYYLALALTICSFFGHLIKGIDYEEATLALFATGVLVFQRKNYYVRSVPLRLPNWERALTVVCSLLIYGIGGFYLLDFRHFNENFTLLNSVVATFKAIALLNTDLNAVTPFGKYFLFSLNILGITSILYLVGLLFRTIRAKGITSENQLEKAKQLVHRFGNSPLDYFKTYPDKEFYFFDEGEGFIAFKATKRYAVVLENPVCKDRDEGVLSKHILNFEKYARSLNLNPIYYRIPERTKKIYEDLGKKLLPMGEEATVDLETFTMEGAAMKPLRNAVNKIGRSGCVFKVSEPPQSDGFLQQLAFVSNDWLSETGKGESGFSQGTFDEAEIKNQTIITVETQEQKVLAFLNLIPGGKAGELNFDLMRKTADAPSGTIDFMFVSMMIHYKEKDYKTVNLGMVPLSGIVTPQNLPEQAIKLAYEKIRPFGHYKNLRFFKEKFNPTWIKCYLAYDTDMDLVHLATVLNKIMKPDEP